MDYITLITIICAIGGLTFSLASWFRNKQEDFEEDGKSEAKLNELSTRIDLLNEHNKKMEKEISCLNTKIDTEVKELKKIIDNNTENNNNNYINLTKILSNLQGKMELIEKKLYAN